jgi:hypothetical protein
VKSKGLFLSCLLLAFAGTGCAATISTGAAKGEVVPFGGTATATLGETFVVPTENILTQFTFSIGPVRYGSTLDTVSAYVGTWDTVNVRLGTLLFTSDSFKLNPASTLTVDTGGVALTSGATYVAFLSVSEYYGEGDGGYALNWAADAGTTGGMLVFSNNGGDFSSLSSSSWNFYAEYPLVFTARFEGLEVPEPGSLGLAASGLLGLLLWRRRR